MYPAKTDEMRLPDSQWRTGVNHERPFKSETGIYLYPPLTEGGGRGRMREPGDGEEEQEAERWVGVYSWPPLAKLFNCF